MFHLARDLEARQDAVGVETGHVERVDGAREVEDLPALGEGHARRCQPRTEIGIRHRVVCRRDGCRGAIHARRGTTPRPGMDA